MHCNNEELIMFVYDELEPERRAAQEKHLAECDACAREAEALRAVAAAVRSGAPVPGPSPEMEERVLTEAATIIIRRKSPWLRLFTLPRTSGLRMAITTGIAAVLIITALLIQQPTGTGTVDAQNAWHDAFYTELVRLAATGTDTSTTGDAVLDQLDADLDQLSLALASY